MAVDLRRLNNRALTSDQEPYVPEMSPVVEFRSSLITRPWAEWARRITALAKGNGNGGGGGGTGDVVGPAGATADAIALYSGTTGKLIKDSLKTLSQLTTDIVNAAIAAILPGGTLPASSLPLHHTRHEPGGSDAMTVDAVAAVGSLRTLGTGAQQAASGTDARFTNARTPTAHATTHQPGGSDAMAVDAAAAVGSLRTLGTGANQAAPGNDARFGAPTTPTAHATTHQLGGSDAIKLDDLATPDDNTDLNVSAVRHGLTPKLSGNVLQYLNGTGAWAAATGSGLGDVTGPGSAVNGDMCYFLGATGKIIGDSGISYLNVARREISNDFVSPQTITNAAGGDSASRLNINDMTQPAENRRFQILNYTQRLRFWALNDAGSGAWATPLELDRFGDIFVQLHAYVGGDIYEKGRTTPVGHWIDVPFNAANFTNGWTVVAGNVLFNKYQIVGNTLTWAFLSSGSSVSGNPSQIQVTLPGGLSGTVLEGPITAYIAGTNLAQNAQYSLRSVNATTLGIYPVIVTASTVIGNTFWPAANYGRIAFTATIVL